MTDSSIDLDRLLKLRLVVARIGEMDVAKWWNTNGQLGQYGAAALRRGFPRTHHFAQARSVFAVATQRCRELYDAPGYATLWQLPEALEAEFDARWEYWIERADEWRTVFARIESLTSPDLSGALRTLELATEAEVEAVARLRRSAEGRTVPLPGMFEPNDATVGVLAIGFAKGELGAPAIPHIRRADL